MGKLTQQREDYYLACLAADADEYYSEAGERQGYWMGSAASRLGLEGKVDGEQFLNVLDGRHPESGEPLVPSAGRDKRVRGFDMTLSPPKSVSVAWAFADPATSQVISHAHDRSVAAVVEVFESEVLRARRGHGGTRQVETDGVVVAAFSHRTSRSGDPQMHTHLVMANLTVDSDGHWSAPDGGRLYHWKTTLGYLYQAQLRHELSERLGMVWTPVTNGYAELVGVDPAIADNFSKRRHQILDEMDRRGVHSAAAAQIATFATRPPKGPSLSFQQLRAQWADEAARLQLPVPDMAALTGWLGPDRPQPGEVIDGLVAPTGLTGRRSSFDRRDLLRAVATAHPQGITTGHARGLADQAAADRRVVDLGTVSREAGARYSTVDLLAVEARILATAERRAGERLGVVAVSTLERELAKRPSLSGEQRAMIARLTLAGEPLDVVVGRAGAGKTFALDAARAAWQQAGYTVVGASLAARAAAELESGAGVPSTTIDRLLLDVERPDPRAGFAPGTVVVVDEAGMVGSRKLLRVLDAAEKHQAKVVLVGDPRQLPEIDAGGAFNALCKTEEAVHLVENRRQTVAWERDALDRLRAGQVAVAVRAYQQHGRIHVYPTADAAREGLVGDWLAVRDDADAAMYAYRRADALDLNRRARLHLRAAGQLGDDATVAGGLRFAPGDRILLLRNDRRLGFRNGDLAEVVDVDPAAGTLTATAGKRTLIVPAEYLEAGHVTFGWAATYHKGQSTTVDRSFLLGSDELYFEAGYSALTRDRHGSDLYIVHNGLTLNVKGVDIPVAAIADLTKHLERSQAQQLAHDHLRDHDHDLGMAL